MRFGGVGTVVLAAGVATCGLFMLGGVGPVASNEVRLPAVVPEPGDETTTTTTTTQASTTTTEASTTTTPATTTTIPVLVGPEEIPPIPLSVTASNTVVGVGGTVTFDGECPVDNDGTPLGPVIVRVTGDSDDEFGQIDTGLSSASWTFTWSAPTADDDIDSFTFQFWCGDPTDFEGGYPASLERRVDVVASAGPPATPPLVESEPPTPVIPETD